MGLANKGTVQMALGDITRIDDRTVFVLGQVLDIAKNQPDVANALVHRVQDTVFLIDTGVTTPFRNAMRRAVDMVGPWKRLVLLTTHGHVDHIGNNDLVDELGVQRAAPVQHFVPAKDLPQMRDPRTYWTHTFGRIAGVVPMPAQPSLVARKVVSLFTPMTPFGRSTRTYEELPVEQLAIGSVRMFGWSFADGAVQVLRSQGHCAGHVIVYLRDSQLLHLGDEANGPCGVMADADQVKLINTLTAAHTMVTEQQALRLTDGHTFTVADADQAATRLKGLLDNAAALQTRAAAVVAGQGSVDPVEFVRKYTDTLAELGVAGANPNPLFTGMMALNTLSELGFFPDGGPASPLAAAAAGRHGETWPAAAGGRRHRSGRRSARLADSGPQPLT